MRAMREMEEVIEAVHVGKHRTESDEMWERSPKMTEATANARAMM